MLWFRWNRSVAWLWAAVLSTVLYYELAMKVPNPVGFTVYLLTWGARTSTMSCFILIGIVFPKAVLIVAVRCWFSLSVSFQAAPLHPCLSMACIMPSAMLCRMLTSRKVMYVSFFISVFCFMVSLILSMCTFLFFLKPGVGLCLFPVGFCCWV